jgi:exodeoxyribonuclease V alpha subunit
MPPAPSNAAPAPTTGSVVGVVERVLLHRPETGYTVLRLLTAEQAPIVVVGVMPAADPGELLRAEGDWYQDRVWGRQFRARAVQVEPPTSEEGLVAYLGSGRIKGLGEVTAKRLVTRFGQDLGTVIEREPGRLREVPGVGAKLAERIAEVWREQRENRDLLLFLASHGIGPARAARILDAYGVRTREKVLGDPYLLAREVRGIGFRTADEIAQKVGLPADSPLRLGAGLGEALREAAGEGHTALPRAVVFERAKALLGVRSGGIEEAAGRELAEGRLAARALPGRDYLLLRELDAAEEAVAARLSDLAGEPAPWHAVEPEPALRRAEEALGVALAEGQAEAIRRALSCKLLIVTGGPGTGKTTLVRGILEALAEEHPDVLLAAPTGRAARRLAESTGREARTLHRLLEADPERGLFRRNAARRLEGDLLVVDEISMVDTTLMAATLDALPPEAALILVGDADQLPSIGPGQVLADLIAAGTVPVLRLTEVFRQAAESAIVRSAHRINRGEPPDFQRTGGEAGLGDLYGIRVEGPDDAEAKLVELLTSRIPERFGLDPVDEVQVLTPVHRGPCGTRSLNDLLRRHLNPAPGAVLERGEARFALADKVMQLENDNEREVYNGDVGRVVAVDRKAHAVEVLIDGRTLRYAGDELDRLAPAYAVTVHKAQGSEYPAIVLPLLRQHGRMLRRNLLYTAVTRARRLAVLLTEPQALERAVRDAGDARRTTLLRERLRKVEWVGP